jgi:LacI family transcriptional regulator
MKSFTVMAAIGGGTPVERMKLRGLHRVAILQGWALHVAGALLDKAVLEWNPRAIVCIDPVNIPSPERRAGRIVVAVGPDLTGQGIPSVVADDREVGREAARHLMSRGLRDFAGFGYWISDWDRERAAGFRAAVKAAGHTYRAYGEPDADGDTDDPAPATQGHHQRILAWLTSLPRPVGVLAGCDSWGASLISYARLAGLRVPEDVCVVGVDNDDTQCELATPPLSSVPVPWARMGQMAAELIVDALAGRMLPSEPVRVTPASTVIRQSSDLIAVDDPDVAKALSVIHEHADRPLTVAQILRKVPVFQHRLERKFRQHVGRRMTQEIRRVHVERAKRLLVSTELQMPAVAQRSGFGSASKLSTAFKRETGMTPTAFRRRYALAR